MAFIDRLSSAIAEANRLRWGSIHTPFCMADFSKYVQFFPVYPEDVVAKNPHVAYRKGYEARITLAECFVVASKLNVNPYWLFGASEFQHAPLPEDKAKLHRKNMELFLSLSKEDIRELGRIAKTLSKDPYPQSI